MLHDLMSLTNLRTNDYTHHFYELVKGASRESLRELELEVRKELVDVSGCSKINNADAHTCGRFSLQKFLS